MEIQKCYRIVEEKNGEYYSLFHGTNGSRKMEKNKWLRADKKRVTDGNRKTATEYESGWHVLLTEQEATEFFDKMFRIKENRKVIPVFVKTPLRRKEHSRRNVFLADEMYVSSEYTMKYLDFEVVK